MHILLILAFLNIFSIVFSKAGTHESYQISSWSSFWLLPYMANLLSESSISSVQSLSHDRLFVTLWTAARQTSLSITNSQSLFKLMSNELVIPFNHLILCHPLFLLPSIFPASGSFPMSQFFAQGAQSNGVSASASVFPMNIQDWFPLGWTGWISLLSKGLSRVFSNTIFQKHQLFSTQLSLVAQRLKHLPPMRETWVRSLGWEDPLEKEMAERYLVCACVCSQCNF